MRLAGTEYSLEHKSFEIYLAGCKAPHCPGCHNPELWDFDAGIEVRPELVDHIIRKINTSKHLVDKIWILGGEPMDQDLELLAEVVMALKLGTELPMWLFTRKERFDVPVWCERAFSYIKYGPYLEERKNPVVYHGVTLATDNQYIICYDTAAYLKAQEGPCHEF